MAGAIRVVDRARDLADFDASAFAEGNVAQWDETLGKFVGRPASYRHSQSSPSATWTIQHNLGRMPHVTVLDSAGTMIIGHVAHTDDNNLVVSFESGFSGTAHLS